MKVRGGFIYDKTFLLTDLKYPELIMAKILSLPSLGNKGETESANPCIWQRVCQYNFCLKEIIETNNMVTAQETLRE